MEVKKKFNYNQVLEFVRQLPANQVRRLLLEADALLQERKQHKDINKLQELLLSAPTMSDEQYAEFLDNRKNKWREK